MNPNLVPLGTRCKGKNSLISSILIDIAAIVVLVFSILFLTVWVDPVSGPKVYEYIFFSVAAVFEALSIFMSVFNFMLYRNNLKALDKPLLIYDMSKDVFVAYHGFKGNKEVVIPKDKLLRVVGSAGNNDRLVSVVYRKENGKKDSVPLGYCTNVDQFTADTAKYIRADVK